MALQKILLPFIPFLVFSCAQTQHDNAIAELLELGWYIDCPNSTLRLDGNLADGLAPKKKRCELANNKWLVRDSAFQFEFTVETYNDNFLGSEWHSVMQVHSFADKKLCEKLRRPVSALEVKNGNFCMFNRWDHQKKSDLVQGTYANIANNIESRLVFDNFKIKSNSAYKIKIAGIMNHYENAYLNVYIYGVLIGSLKAPQRSMMQETLMLNWAYISRVIGITARSSDIIFHQSAFNVRINRPIAV
jgi:hypothetical protein